MRWRAGGRPRRGLRNCAVFWTNTKGEADEQLRELGFAGGFADARMDVVALPLARRGGCGFVYRGVRGMPERGGALRAGGGRARLDDGVAGRYFLLVALGKQSGRSD